jgi:hypothetical protein
MLHASVGPSRRVSCIDFSSWVLHLGDDCCVWGSDLVLLTAMARRIIAILFRTMELCSWAGLESKSKMCKERRIALFTRIFLALTAGCHALALDIFRAMTTSASLCLQIPPATGNVNHLTTYNRVGNLGTVAISVYSRSRMYSAARFPCDPHITAAYLGAAKGSHA